MVKQLLNGPTRKVNEAIFSQPYIKPKFIGEILGVTSRTTLTKYFGELVSAKVLKEVYYINDDLVQILKG